ncbi:MAG: hypothetical protein M3P18_21850 [Actinomycetota bacterium]|nr:hypothetical protein [Actinomycetota bacterium]
MAPTYKVVTYRGVTYKGRHYKRGQTFEGGPIADRFVGPYVEEVKPEAKPKAKK